MSFQATRPIRLIVTLSIGTMGGWFMSQFQIPLAWMLGSMLTTTFIAMSGRYGDKLQGSPRLHTIMLAVLGVMLGSTFTPDVIDHLGNWINTLSVMTGFVLLLTALGYTGLRRLYKFNRPTAFFSAMPGNFTAMVITGGEMGGDERTIALIHSVRIMLTVLVIPFWFRFTEGVVSANRIADTISLLNIDLKEMALLGLVGVAGVYGAKWIRMPAYSFVGPIIVSAAVHLLAITSAKPPIEMINIAQVVIGTSIGCRFVGTSVRKVPAILFSGVVTGLYMLGAAALAASILSPLTKISFAALWLAFAPGGLAEMAMMSIALGIDPAFVTTHHLYRLILLIVFAPLFYRLLEHWVSRRVKKSAMVNPDNFTD